MDHLSRLRRQLFRYLAVIFLLNSTLLLSSWWVLENVFGLTNIWLLVALGAIAAVVSLVMTPFVLNRVVEPVKVLWQAILHVSSENSLQPAPNINEVRVGKELLTSLCLEVYQLASRSTEQGKNTVSEDLQTKTIAASLPVPLLVMDKSQTIVFANDAVHKYLGLASGELNGKNLYSMLDLRFPTSDTFDSWLTDAKSHTITSSRSWEHIRLNRANGQEHLQFDMAAYYNKENPSGIETIITMFDHSSAYNQEDNSVGYVAMAVHELRTPLTLLRGYIEVFEEELTGKLNPELSGYLAKMQASAQQLAAFTNNILNMARVEADQLTLQLHEENINDLVNKVAGDLKLRASTRDKNIETQLEGELPTVAADKVSLYEVLINLLDNAIKYSGNSHKIIVSTGRVDNDMVEVTVQDFGVGIATNVLPHLFEKFYRSHRTQKQVSGTGLGLYLSKAIVTAHGGNIWVRSKEGEGTTIGFTLKPYSQLADELRNSDNKGIVRNAYGWIKNHSLYRR